MKANCLPKQPSTPGVLVVVIVVIVIVVLVRPGFSAADVHQLLADLTPLVGLILGTGYLVASNRSSPTD